MGRPGFAKSQRSEDPYGQRLRRARQGDKHPLVTVSISSRQTAMRVPRAIIAELVEFVAKRQNVRAADVDIAVVSGREMARLNWQYLRHKGATDVLSFDLSAGRPYGRGTSVEAQIIVCTDVAKAVGPLHGLSPRNELLLYVTHGLLHMMGYDDVTSARADNMQARADELLREFVGM